ncbi:hypothetical protein ABEB36_013193 [Hypothenemus hampei]|uniref:Protein prenyltransferase alpha subunit repeat-containing protein 1 n=1 Tax=Hypothenemus hampei TaxID=57062 RepID=A0ABD1EBL3_HYPHA
MEYSCMADKILRSLEKKLSSRELLESGTFEIIVTDNEGTNTNPVKHVYNHLGLESWCVKYVYQHACSNLMGFRRNLATKILSFDEMQNLNYLLMGALLLHPEVTTFWNMRRELVQAKVLNIEFELAFSRLVLTRKKKSNETFSYRRWLLKQLYETKVTRNNWCEKIRREFSICQETAEGAPNNYHSWGHKQWCLNTVPSSDQQFFIDELSTNESWISNHVSEGSAYHFRTLLLPHCCTTEEPDVESLHESSLHDICNAELFSRYSHRRNGTYFANFLTYLFHEVKSDFDNRNKKLEYLYRNTNMFSLYFRELYFVPDFSVTFLEHESMFMYRRAIICQMLVWGSQYLNEKFDSTTNLDLIQHFKPEPSNANIIDVICNTNIFDVKKPKLCESEFRKLYKTTYFKILCNLEKNFINSNSSDSDIQREYLRRHENWLFYVMGINLKEIDLEGI